MRNLLSIILSIALPLIAFGAPPVSGKYAKQISKIDIEQIQAAVSKERGIGHNLKKIEAIRPDKVAVQTYNRTGVDEDTFYDFKVQKGSAGWAVDVNSIQMSIEKRDLRTNGQAVIR